MAAGPAVTRSNGIDRTDETAVRKAAAPRALLSQQEGILLRTALGIALLAAVISIVARMAASWPIAAPIAATGLLIVGLGAIAYAALGALTRVGQKAQAKAAATPISLTGILDELPVGIAVWDRRGTLIQANRPYTDYFELAPPDVITGSPRTSIRAKGGRVLDEIITEQETGNSQLLIERRVVANGTIIETLTAATFTAEPERIDAEREAHIRELIAEISRLTTHNDELLSENSRLEADMTEAHEAVAAATRTKSEFLSHMSHELRTPLNAILGFTGMMRGHVFGPLGHEKYEEYVDDIHESGEQLSGLISDILDVSQIQAGEVPIERHRIDLEKTLASCLTLLRSRIFAAGIALTELIDDLPTVYADPIAVRQILLHILSNAMKFTLPGGRISIKADVNQDFVTLIIDDTGCGIAPEVMERIDQPFSSVGHDALISGNEGVGLGVGISVSRSLARLNGGDISIESEQGYGTTVRITLPRR